MTLSVREALLTFRRWPALSLLSITTIAFALFVVGMFALVALNLRNTLRSIEERVEIVMYLTRGTPIENATIAIEDIEAFPEVASVRYVTEEEALLRANEEMVEFQGIFGELETNPLPASFEIQLLPGYRNTESANLVSERLRGFAFAEDIRYGQDWVEKLDDLRGVAGLVGLLIGGAFAIASLIIIGTTIRMSVMQRAREISIMRLVGATDSFIRRPFLLEGCLKGALGGLAAVGLNFAAFYAIDRVLFNVSFFSVPQAALIVGFGLGLGLLASATSVGRHLRQV